MSRSTNIHYKEFYLEVQKDLMDHHLSKKLSDKVIVDGHHYGFHDEEINRILEECYANLVKLRPSTG